MKIFHQAIITISQFQKVKANRDSQNRKSLIDARNVVSSATANLVASAKSCLQTIEDKSRLFFNSFFFLVSFPYILIVFCFSGSLDFSNLSLHQTKRMEMESQCKVLELEKMLEGEKKNLYKLRKQHYQLGGINEGWDADSSTN